MAKNKTTLEEALLDFVSAVVDAAKILKEDLSETSADDDGEDDADDGEDDADDEAPAKPAKGAKAAKGKKVEQEEEDEDESEDEEDEAPKKGAKAAKGKKVAEEDDKDEDDEDSESEVEYTDVQKAVVKAAKANGRDFVAERLKRFGKKVDHASKLKPEQYADFIEALSEEADED